MQNDTRNDKVTLSARPLPHPEILAVLGDDVYTTLPSFPVTVGGDAK